MLNNISLYRKYRPKNFEEMSGQNQIIKVLKNALIKNKITHAYLFSGPRGTGKTSTAKIIGKLFNCLEPIDGKSCDKCISCTAIENNDITILFGKAGTAKTTLPLSYFFHLKDKGKISKINIINSYDTLKGANTLGYVKGELETKLLNSSSIGGILASKLGDMTEVENLMRNGFLNIIPTANIRGVEFDDIVYVTECQNIDLYTLRTILQRCKQGCKVILEGDIFEQIDTSRGCGLFRMIDVFKGYDKFGMVKLKNCYRSEFSGLADKM